MWIRVMGPPGAALGASPKSTRNGAPHVRNLCKLWSEKAASRCGWHQEARSLPNRVITCRKLMFFGRLPCDHASGPANAKPRDRVSNEGRAVMQETLFQRQLHCKISASSEIASLDELMQETCASKADNVTWSTVFGIDLFTIME